MKEYKVIKLDPEFDRDKHKDSWNVVGVKDKYRCPECEYLGRPCDIHDGGDNSWR